MGIERINSLGGFWKRQTFAFFVFLSSRFHEPIQFPSRLGIFLHLPVPIIIFDWIKKSSQFTTLLRTELLDRGLDFFHPAHARNVLVDAISGNRTYFAVHEHDLRRRTPSKLSSPHIKSADGRIRGGEHQTSNIKNPALSDSCLPGFLINLLAFSNPLAGFLIVLS